MNLQDLIAKKVQLESELAQVSAAIAAFGDSTPVQIRTWKNIKNTAHLGCVDFHPQEGDLVVFVDKEFTKIQEGRFQSGWVVKSDWEQFCLAHPEMVGSDMSVCEVNS